MDIKDIVKAFQDVLPLFLMLNSLKLMECQRYLYTPLTSVVVSMLSVALMPSTLLELDNTNKIPFVQRNEGGLRYMIVVYAVKQEVSSYC